MNGCKLWNVFFTCALIWVYLPNQRQPTIAMRYVLVSASATALKQLLTSPQCMIPTICTIHTMQRAVYANAEEAAHHSGKVCKGTLFLPGEQFTLRSVRLVFESCTRQCSDYRTL